MTFGEPFNITYKLETERQEWNKMPVYVTSIMEAELYYKDPALGLIKVVLEPEFLTTNARDAERYMSIESIESINYPDIFVDDIPLVKVIFKERVLSFVLEREEK